MAKTGRVRKQAGSGQYVLRSAEGARSSRRFIKSGTAARNAAIRTAIRQGNARKKG